MTHSIGGRTVSEVLPQLAKFLLEHGDETGSRNGRVMEALNVQVEIDEPTRREILTIGRRANVFAQIAETMWVLSGRDDIEWLGAYLPRAKDYSDDGVSWRGAYGPRIRGGVAWKDQLEHAVNLLKKDPLSRRAVIGIYDSRVDMEDGKDIPCNDFLQFQSRLGKLHMTVTVRSNDLFWGWSGINAFEWSTLQEIVASLLGIEVGPLVFNIGNLHLYERHWERARRMEYENIRYQRSFPFNPDRDVTKMYEVDDMIEQWFLWENMARGGFVRPEMLGDFTDPMFRAWAAAIAYYWTRWPEWLDLLDGTALAAAIAKTPQSVLPEPVQRSHGRGPGMGPGDGLSDRSRAFYDFVSNLHATKHKSYGDSWKRRGEKMSILANIARKVDRLGVDDQFESEADTVIDLWVYLAKYLDWIHGGDSGPGAVDSMLHASLSRVDDLGRHYATDLRDVQKQMNEYLDLAAYSTVADRSKKEFVERMMQEILPYAVDIWERENSTEPLFEMTDSYRGADVD